jgi:putative flippase GtrA
MSSRLVSSERPGVAWEVLRYVLNGLFATFVHYSILLALLESAGMSSAGLANTIAAGFGIAVSFLGSRYFVFRNFGRSIAQQVVRFVPLYAALAGLHGVLLFLWTDLLGFDYRLGFLIAIGLQFAVSFVANKYWVFAE